MRTRHAGLQKTRFGGWIGNRSRVAGWGCGGNRGLPGGSSCIHTKTASERSSSTSNWGKHTGATIRQLGYPTKNSLKGWHKEYERCLDLSRGYVLSKSKYSLAQREKAVGYYLDHGRCIASTIKALGYPARFSRYAQLCAIMRKTII